MPGIGAVKPSRPVLRHRLGGTPQPCKSPISPRCPSGSGPLFAAAASSIPWVCSRRGFWSGRPWAPRDCRCGPATLSRGSRKASDLAAPGRTSRGWRGASRRRRICGHVGHGMCCWHRPSARSRIVPAPVTSWSGATFSSLMPLRYRGRVWWLRARLTTDVGTQGLAPTPSRPKSIRAEFNSTSNRRRAPVSSGRWPS